MGIMEIVALVTMLGVGGIFIYIFHNTVRQDEKREREREGK